MNKAALLLLLTTVIASVACMHLVRELREEREQSALLQAQIAELERTSRAPLVNPTSPFVGVPAETAPAAPPQPMTSSPAAPSTTTPATPFDRSEELRSHFERQQEWLGDPEYREAMRAQHRFGLMANYPNLASELALTQEEADSFLDLLAEQQMKEMVNRGSSFFRDTPRDENVLREARELALQRHEQYQNEIESLLGPSKYQAWKSYQETLGQRHRVASLQSSLALAGAPLNQTQSAALLSALVDEQRRQQQTPASTDSSMQPDRTTAMEAWIDLREQQQHRVLDSLRSSLTEPQISHLQEVFRREIELQRVHLKMQRATPSDNAAGNVVFSTEHYAGEIGFAPPVAVIESIDDREPASD